MSESQNLEEEQVQAKLLQKAEDLRREFTQFAKQMKAYSGQAREKAVEAVEVAAEWTKDHPLTAIGIAAGLGASVGFLLGMLVGRK